MASAQQFTVNSSSRTALVGAVESCIDDAAKQEKIFHKLNAKTIGMNAYDLGLLEAIIALSKSCGSAKEYDKKDMEFNAVRTSNIVSRHVLAETVGRCIKDNTKLNNISAILKKDTGGTQGHDPLLSEAIVMLGVYCKSNNSK